MPAIMQIPYFLQQDTGGLKNIEVHGKTVGESLQELFKKYPAIEKDLFTQGKLGKHFILYVNDEKIPYPNGLDRTMKNGDTLSIEVALLAGG